MKRGKIIVVLSIVLGVTSSLGALLLGFVPLWVVTIVTRAFGVALVVVSAVGMASIIVIEIILHKPSEYLEPKIIQIIELGIAISLAGFVASLVGFGASLTGFAEAIAPVETAATTIAEVLVTVNLAIVTGVVAYLVSGVLS